MQLCKEQLTYFVLDERDRVEKAIPLFGSWYSKSTSELTDKGMTFAQVTECRIPAEYAPQGFAPKENDMLLRPAGGCTAQAPIPRGDGESGAG